MPRRGVVNTVGAVGGTALAASVLRRWRRHGSVPVTGVRYTLVANGQEIASFSEVVAIEAVVEPVEYRDGSEPDVARLLGKAKPPTITLRRSLTSGLELWTWHQAARAGQMAQARRNCTLVIFEGAGKTVAKFALARAWPTKLEVGAGAGGVLVETVTLVGEGIERLAP